MLFLYPPGDQDKEAAVKRVMLLVAKQRNGLADVSVELSYTRATTAFAEVDVSERQAFSPKRERRKTRPSFDGGPGVVDVRDADAVLDTYGAGDGLPDVDVPAAQLGFDDLGPQDEAAGAA